MATYVNPKPVPLPTGSNGTWATIASGCAAGAVGVTLLFISKPNAASTTVPFGLRKPGSTDTQQPFVLSISNVATINQVVASTGVDSSGNFQMYLANSAIGSNANNYSIYLLKDYAAGSAVFLTNAVTVFGPGWPTTATEYPLASAASAAGAAAATGCFLEALLAYRPSIMAHGSTDTPAIPANAAQAWIMGFNPTDTNKNIKCVAVAGGNTATSILYCRGFILAGFVWNVNSIDRSSLVTAANTLTPLPTYAAATEYIYRCEGGAAQTPTQVMSTSASPALPLGVMIGNAMQLVSAGPPAVQVSALTTNVVRELGYFQPPATPAPTWNRARVNVMTTSQNVQ